MRRGIVLVLIVGALLTGCGEGPGFMATSTPAATATTAATATPTLKRYTPDDVTRVLSPLGASNFRFTPPASPSLAPNTAIDQRDFAIPSVAPKGGQALFFDSAQDVAGMQAWYARFPDLAPYVYAKGNVVLQLNSGVPKVEAERYRMALESLP